MKLRALIIDDMALSRSRTRRYLIEEPDVEVVGECEDAESALISIETLKPDLILLDVQMPKGTGFDLIKRLRPEQRPAVVFITAFEEFAVQAFDAQAMDYLLKPFDHDRLRQALAKVTGHLKFEQMAKIENSSVPAALPSLPSKAYLDRIPVKSVGKTVFVMVISIDWIQTAGNYITLHCGKEVHLIRETMARFEAQLDPTKFVRIHRSTIVRLDAVKEMQPLFNGDQTLLLHGGGKLTLSRTYRGAVAAFLGES